MAYLWIFIGCYFVAFIIINIKLSAQTANMNARITEFGGTPEQLKATLRQQMSLPKELFIRAWAPLVISLIPTATLSLGYFIFR